MQKRLEKAVALVTGGGTGIGRAIANRLAQDGANVIIIGPDATTLQDSARQHDQISYLVADLTQTADIQRVVQDIQQQFKRLDILVNNAGVAPVTLFAKMDIREFDQVYDVNVRGLIDITHQALPLLKSAQGTIINISTSMVDCPMANMSVYASSKAAVNTLTRVWAKELAQDGIRVNSVGVGPIETPIYSKTDLSAEAARQHFEAVKRLIPMGRFGRAEEVASVVAFLASDEASFVTGSDYAVDGGFGA